ncbi:MAG TPA: cyanophycinase [Candidatus Limnocylindrales bacterium]|nr:cyanophycinase [Candidatus Limnocylindrales bacterium]
MEFPTIRQVRRRPDAKLRSERLKSMARAKGWRILPGAMTTRRISRTFAGMMLAGLTGLASLGLAASGRGETPGLKIFSLAAAKPKPAGDPSPGVALVGGGGDVDEATRFLCDHSHGGDVVVLRASGKDDYDPYFHDLCPNNSVTTLLTTSAEGANSPAALKAVREAHAIFLAGGDQSNYVKFWAGDMQKEINAAIARGVPIGGISAGLAVLGEFAFSARHDTVTSPEALANPFDEKVTLDRGFLSIPTLRGIITDSHFSPRKRIGRTVAFLARIEQDGWANPARAIGIDESTAVLVEPSGKATIAGKGSAYFLELAHRPEQCEPGKPLTVRHVQGYKVGAGAGSSFDLKSWAGTGGEKFELDVVNGEMTQSNQ